MKSILLAIVLFLTFMQQGVGQIPQQFSYQAVIRNSEGTIMNDEPVNIIIKLRKNSITGDVIFTEAHNCTTTGQGLISLLIGSVNTTGFPAIPWNENIFIQVDIKKTSESTYRTIGPSQILSVPYALSAGYVKEVKSQSSSDDAIFEVKNSKGEVVFGVYQGGVRVYIDDSPAIKGARGGFAIGGITNQGKGLPVEYFRITPDSARIYINDKVTKGARGGFAIGGITNQSKSSSKEYFKVTKDTSFFTTTVFANSNILSTGTVSTGAGVISTSIKDIDNNDYQTVKIGTQIWMKENLQTTRYADGANISPGDVVAYDNKIDPDTLKVYGRLYSVTAVSAANLCPTGWSVPSYNDWNTLFTFLGGPNWQDQSSITGLKMMEIGTIADGKGYWRFPNLANNVSQFSGRPAGYFFSMNTDYFDKGMTGYWRSSDSWLIRLDGSGNLVLQSAPEPADGYSVRCIKDL